MKKTFSFTTPNKKPERQVDAIKYEVKKYLARERRKELPEDIEYWYFDCKIGDNEESALEIKPSEINSKISGLFDEKKESFYLEILAKPGFKKKKKEA
jgi:hypothetical protein